MFARYVDWQSVIFDILGISVMAKSTKEKTILAVKVSAACLVALLAIYLLAPRAMGLLGLGPEPPIFKFDKSLAPGWTSEGNDNPQDVARAGLTPASDVEKLPVATLALVQDAPEGERGCFAVFSYYSYATNTEDLLEGMVERTEADGVTKLVEVDSYVSKVKTHRGEKEYKLHQYDMQVSGEAQADMMHGVGLGYIDMEDSYIDIRAYCATAKELTSLSLPLGIGAVRLISQD